MIDTIALYLDKSEIDTNDLIRDIEPLLTSIENRFQTKNGINVTKGTFSNFQVTVRETGIYLIGSIPKFYLGNNLQSLNVHQMQEALTLLGDSLNLPLEIAQVTRVDFGINLETRERPKDYYPFLGKRSKYNCDVIGNGVYYRTTQYHKNGKKRMPIKTNVFYDKIEELRAKNQNIPLGYQDTNILRYEIRFLRNVKPNIGKKVFNRGLYGKDLYDPKLLKWLNDQWFDSYQKTQKIDSIFWGDQDASNAKEYVKALAKDGIEYRGGVSNVLDSIEAAYQNKAFGEGAIGRQRMNRVRKMVLDICASPDNCRVSPLLAELDERFLESHERIQNELTKEKALVKV